MATNFTVTAPDGSTISFNSKARTYAFAVLCRPTEATAAESGRKREWKIVAKVGSPERIYGAMYEQDRRFNCIGRWDAVTRRWTYTPDAVLRFELIPVPVVAA